MNNQRSKIEPVIDIKNFDYYFGKGELRKQVLFNINLEINRGEIILMTSPSGSGKTTLLTLVNGLRLVSGLRSPQSGSCKILGKELCGASSAELVQARRNNGYIFQAHNLHYSLTAAQNVQMGLEVQGKYSKSQMRDRAVAMLEEVGLAERVDYYPDKLSGAQKPRVAIARVVSRPAIVLADEPTAALDSKSGRDAIDIMQKLAREQGSTILLVTHDERILDIADRIVHMEDGILINNSVK